MLSPSQYLTPDRGRAGGGVAGLRDLVLSPRGPHQLFGLGPGGDHGGLRAGGGLLRPDTMSSMIRPEFTSTPASNTQSPPQSLRDYTAISSFLTSSGPLLSAAIKLLANPYIRY